MGRSRLFFSKIKEGKKYTNNAISEAVSGESSQYRASDRWPSLHASGDYEGSRIKVVPQIEMRESRWKNKNRDDGGVRTVEWMDNINRLIRKIIGEKSTFGDVFQGLYDEDEDGKIEYNQMQRFRDFEFDDSEYLETHPIELSVKCRKCGAEKGAPCKNTDGFHSERKEDVREERERIQKINVDYDYFFKVWLQSEYEKMIVGERSIYILRGADKSKEEKESEDVLEALTNVLEEAFNRMLNRDSELSSRNDQLLDMIRAVDHIKRMYQIYSEPEESIPGVKEFCRIVVKSLLAGSRIKSTTDKGIFRTRGRGELKEFSKQQSVEMDFGNLTISQLKEKLKQRKLPLSGNKATLVARLIDDGGTKSDIINHLIQQGIKPKREWVQEFFPIRTIPLMGFFSALRGVLAGQFESLERGLGLFPDLVRKLIDTEQNLLDDGDWGDHFEMDDETKALLSGMQKRAESPSKIELLDEQEVTGELLVIWLKGYAGSTTKKIAKMKSILLDFIRKSKVSEEDVAVFGVIFDRYLLFQEEGWPTSSVSTTGLSPKRARLKVIDHQMLRFSWNIVICLVTELRWIYLDMGHWEDVEDHYWRDDGRGGDLREEWQNSPPNMLRFNRNFLQRFFGSDDSNEHAVFRTLRQDPRRWMYCEPENHRLIPSELGLIPDGDIHVDKVKPGGFVSTGYQGRGGKTNAKNLGRVVLNNQLYQKLAEIHDEIDERALVGERQIQALNSLQKAQWEVNLDFLQAIAVACKKGQDGGEERIWQPMREQDQKWVSIRFRNWLEECKERNLGDNKKGTRRKWEDWDSTLINVRKAIQVGHNVFWHSWAVDYRGRFLPRTPSMSPQGDDFDRALIRFKEWKPLGKDGIRWFYIHVCNLFSKREWAEDSGCNWVVDPLTGRPVEADAKSPFEKRFQWTKDNLETLRKIAQEFTPIKQDYTPKKQFTEILGLQGKPRSGDESFQRLAVVLELDRIHSLSDDGIKLEDVTSGQPVYLDASNNGFQHAAALLRYRQLAEAVNVVKSADGREQDLYQRVADEAQRRFEAKESTFRDELEILANQLPEIFAKTERWVEVFNRKMVKIPTMVSAYGAKDLLKCFIGREGKGKPGFTKREPLTIEQVKADPERYNCPTDWTQKHRCKRNKKGSFGKPVDLGNGKMGLPPCNVPLANLEAFVRHMNEEHPWEAKLHESSPLVDAIEKEKLIKIAYGGEWDAVYEITINEEGKDGQNITKIEQKSLNRILYGLANKLTNDVQSVINHVTGHAYKKIGEQGLVKIHDYERILDPKNGGVTWDTGKTPHVDDGMGRTQLFKLQGMRIRNLDVKLKKKSSVSFWQLWNMPDAEQNSAPVLFPEIRNFLVRMDVPIGPLPDNLEQRRGNQAKERPYKYNLSEQLRKLQEMSGIGEEDKQMAQYLEQRMLERSTFTWDNFSDYDPSDNGKDAKRSVTPNFIHSLDAAHMREAILKLKAKNIKDFWAVHDCFGTHACDIEKMRTVVKDSFRQLHEDRDFGDWLIELHPHGFNIEQKILKTRGGGRLGLEGIVEGIDDRPGDWKGLSAKELKEKLQEKIPENLYNQIEKEWLEIQKNIRDPKYVFGANFSWFEYGALKCKICAILHLEKRLEKPHNKTYCNEDMFQKTKGAWARGEFEKVVGLYLGWKKPYETPKKKILKYKEIKFISKDEEVVSNIYDLQFKLGDYDGEWDGSRLNENVMIESIKKVVGQFKHQLKQRKDWMGQKWKGKDERVLWKGENSEMPLVAPSKQNIGKWDGEKLVLLNMDEVKQSEFMVS